MEREGSREHPAEGRAGETGTMPRGRCQASVRHGLRQHLCPTTALGHMPQLRAAPHVAAEAFYQTALMPGFLRPGSEVRIIPLKRGLKSPGSSRSVIAYLAPEFRPKTCESHKNHVGFWQLHTLRKIK